MESFKAGDKIGLTNGLDTIERIEGEYAYFVGGGGWRIDRMAARVQSGEWFVVPSAKPSRLTDDARERAYRTAQRLARFDSSEPYEKLVGEGLLAERAEADRLGSLLDSVVEFLTKHALDPEPRNVLADVLLYIGKNRRAK